MDTEKLPTSFAPAERAAPEQIALQAGVVNNCALMDTFLGAVSDIVVVLNRERQIVYANKNLLDMAKCKVANSVHGMRPGEVLDCIHSDETAGGCGTTEFCKTCGAVNAILEAQAGRPADQECRIIQKEQKGSLDLRVQAIPLEHEFAGLSLFVASDISAQNRRLALERIFFHDILNTAGGLRGLTEILLDLDAEEALAFRQMILESADTLIDEIKNQRDLLAAENNELPVNLTTFSSLRLIEELRDSYQENKLGENRVIRINEDAEDVSLVSDRVLLRRVLGNMLKNGLEASRTGDVVTIGCNLRAATVEFWVQNPSCMPREIQLQVFQRSFSTKGAGRGLGTYGMKLLSERYLNSSVTFTSSAANGTIFKVACPDEWPEVRT